MGQTLSAVPEKMQENQKVMMMSQREMMMSMQVAKMRDDFKWLTAFQGTVASLLTIGFLKTHNPRLLIPFVPLGFSFSYMYDATYGGKFDRILAESENILKNERSKFQLPEGNRLMSPQEYAFRIIGESNNIGGGV